VAVDHRADLGGDRFDVFRLSDRRLAVTVGDVMGKGLLAAAGMGRVRNALRPLALTDPRPAAVLAGLDQLFTATELEDYVTTVTYLVIDPETGEGQAGNVGHPPPLLLTPDALPVLDGAEAGTPLGWASPRRQHGAPELLLQYLLDHMLAGQEQGDDIAVLVMSRPFTIERS